MIKKILLDISKIVNSTAIAQLLPLLALPLFSRLYSPHDFADFAIYLATAAISSVLFSLRAEVALLTAKKSQRAIRAHIQLITLLALAMLMILCVFYGAFLLIFQAKHYLLLGIITGLFWAIFNTFQNYLIWAEQMNRLGFVIVLKSVFIVSFTITLANISHAGQIWGFFLSYLLIALYALYKMKQFLSKFSKRNVLYALKKNAKNLKYLAPHTLYNMLTLQTPTYILSAFYSAANVGLYSMANRLIGTPISFVTVATNKILHKQFATRFKQGDHIEQWRLAKKILAILVAFFSIGLMIFFIYGKQIITLLLGENWSSTFSIIIALSPWFLFRTIAGAFSFITILRNKQKMALLFEIGYGIISLGTLTLCGFFELNFLNSVQYFSAIGSIIVAVQLYWYRTLIKRSNCER